MRQSDCLTWRTYHLLNQSKRPSAGQGEGDEKEKRREKRRGREREENGKRTGKSSAMQHPTSARAIVRHFRGAGAGPLGECEVSGVAF